MLNASNQSQSGNTIVAIMAQLVLIALCIGYVGYVFKAYILPDLKPAEYFKDTECLVMSKRTNEQGQLLTRYRAEFLVSYNVNGVQYSRWVSGNGLDNSFSFSENSQDLLLARFDVGQSYPCYYSPENPQLSLLAPRTDWLTIVPLLLPALIGFLALYYLVINFLRLLGLRRY